MEDQHMTPAGQRWTRERPTVEGWYWFRRIDLPLHCSRTAVLEVSMVKGVLSVYEDYGDGVLWHPLKQYKGEWQGPLSPNDSPHEATVSEALFPIQRESGVKPHPTRIPWSVAELAYSGYSAENGRGQSLERLAERHGFYPSEMDKYLPDWRERCDEIKALRDERDRLRSALEDIRDSIGNGALNVDWIKKCAAAALTPATGAPSSARREG